MYVHSVKLINYKSIGDYDESEIIVEPRVTAIIGRNESGKSNILDGLSKINFSKRKSLVTFSNASVNRSCGDQTKIRYVITLKSGAEDIDLGILEDSVIDISYDKMTVTGGLLTYYETNISEAVCAVANMLDLLGGGNPLKLSQNELTLLLIKTAFHFKLLYAIIY